jgi:5'-nucleotidase
MNGGGIRNNSILPPGVVTELHTFEILPFASFVTLVPEVSRETLRAVLENAVSLVEDDAGRFAQVSGVRMTWDLAADAGSRIIRVELDDGTVLVEDGEVVEGEAVGVATIDFLARGGDGYAFGDAMTVSTGATYQSALASFIAGALEGEITAEAYPVEGTGRITQVD